MVVQPHNLIYGPSPASWTSQSPYTLYMKHSHTHTHVRSLRFVLRAQRDDGSSSGDCKTSGGERVWHVVLSGAILRHPMLILMFIQTSLSAFAICHIRSEQTAQGHHVEALTDRPPSPPTHTLTHTHTHTLSPPSHTITIAMTTPHTHFR